MISIQVYQPKYQLQIIDLILNIQQNEFGISITLEDQPDLLDISSFYQRDKGNFWIATDHDTVIGTVALIDMGDHQGAIRKVFVHQSY